MLSGGGPSLVSGFHELRWRSTAVVLLTKKRGATGSLPHVARPRVEWPRGLHESTAASFVEEYDREYYQREAFEDAFEPRSRLDASGVNRAREGSD